LASRHLHGHGAQCRGADQGCRGAEPTPGRRYGRAVRQQPARVRARAGDARCRDRALPESAGSYMEGIGAFARGRLHRPHGRGQGQLRMSTLLATTAPRARSSSGFLRRTWAMLIKEFIQLKRDRVSFAMIIMIPLVQLLLFGYAINTN